METKSKAETGRCFCPYCDEEMAETSVLYCQACEVTIFYCPKCRKPVPRDNRVCPYCKAEIKGGKT